MARDDPDRERVQQRAAERQHERAESVEHAAAEVEDLLEDHSYPVSSEELATEYADQPIDLPNETETLGSVFDRLSDEYRSPAEAREALYNELTGEAAGPEEYNDERPLQALADEEADEEPGGV